MVRQNADLAAHMQLVKYRLRNVVDLAVLLMDLGNRQLPEHALRGEIRDEAITVVMGHLLCSPVFRESQSPRIEHDLPPIASGTDHGREHREGDIVKLKRAECRLHEVPSHIDSGPKLRDTSCGHRVDCGGS